MHTHSSCRSLACRFARRHLPQVGMSQATHVSTVPCFFSFFLCARVRVRVRVWVWVWVGVRARARVQVRIERLQVLPGHEADAVGRLDHPPG